MLREEAFLEGEHSEWYQLSKSVRCEYDRPTRTIVSLKINGEEVQDDKLYKVIMQSYHYLNIGDCLDLRREEIERNGKPIEVASNLPNVLEEYFASHPLIEYDDLPRLIIHE